MWMKQTKQKVKEGNLIIRSNTEFTEAIHQQFDFILQQVNKNFISFGKYMSEFNCYLVNWVLIRKVSKFNLDGKNKH